MTFDPMTSKGLFPDGLPVHDTIARIVSKIKFNVAAIDYHKNKNQLQDSKDFYENSRRLSLKVDLGQDDDNDILFF